MEVFGKIFETFPSSPETADAHIGHCLRQIRLLAGLTQVQVAERLRIGQSAVTRLEGRKDLHVSTLRDYLGALGATLRIDAHFQNASDMINSVREADSRLEELGDDQLTLPIVGAEPLPPHRDVVFSIKPNYSRKIVAGKKTVELRRRFPRSVPTGTKALIYETSPTRALSGIADIGAVHRGSPQEIWANFADQACILRVDFDTYFAGVDAGFAIELKNARRLRRPVNLSELRERFGFEPPQSFLYLTPKMREAIYDECA